MNVAQKTLSFVFTILTFYEVMYVLNESGVLLLFYTLDQFGATACVNIRIP
jgi:hypothetical protein